MGYYYNPPEELPKVARAISGHNYATLKTQLEKGEKLFGHYDRFIFQNAPWLFSAEELEEFEHQARQGIIMRLGFYAMPETVFTDIFGHITQEQEG